MKNSDNKRAGAEIEPIFDKQANIENFEKITDEYAQRLVEALLFASSIPLTERQISNRLPYEFNVKKILKLLSKYYEGRGFRLVNFGASWAFRTAPDLADIFSRDVEVTRKLSRAAIETLSIIAYHQPVTRSEIEEVRGISVSKGTLDVLLEKGWIKPKGRRETPGRPLMWATSDTFLDQFGLQKLTELPGLKELKAMGLLDSSPAITVYQSNELPDDQLELLAVSED